MKVMGNGAPFFDFWRSRVAFIEQLDPRENFYESNVLTWAVVDSLANHWARAFKRRPPTHRRRLGDFLERHGGVAFGRMSLPQFWMYADETDPSVVGPEVRDRIRSFRGRRSPDAIEERQARIADHEPTTAQVLTELADVVDVPVAKGRTIRDLVLASRFGEIAYETMRCAIVHEGRLADGAHAFDFGRESALGPTYLGGLFVVPPTIGFAPPFMTRVALACIDGFEREASTVGVDPTPPVRDIMDLDLDAEP